MVLWDVQWREEDDCVKRILEANVPYILAYKWPPKNRVRMWSKIIDPYKSQVVFEDLYWMQALLNRGLLLCALAAVQSVVVTDVKATRRAAGRGRCR